MIDVAGVTVPRAAIAKLAAHLQANGNGTRLIGHRLGRAIDANANELPLADWEAQAIVWTLAANPIDELEPLRHALARHPGL